MAGKGPVGPTKLRRETQDWLTTHTLPEVRSIATDLENAGEDVRDLFQAIDELEALVRGGPPGERRRPERTPDDPRPRRRVRGDGTSSTR